MKLMLLLFIALIANGNSAGSLEFPQKNLISVERGILTAPLSEEDFIVKNDNTILELCSNYSDLETAEQITDAHYATERRAYDTFVYENFNLGANSKIFQFSLTTSVFETHRGVKVGDSILIAFRRYGMGEKKEKSIDFSFDEYRYSYKQKSIIFFVDENGVIIMIKFEFI